MPGNNAFQPLADADFAVLEDRGKVTFSPENRARLNEWLGLLCGPDGDRRIRKEVKAAAEIRVSVARDAGSLLANLRKLEGATEPGARLAAWTLFPMERRRQFGDPRVTGEMLGFGLTMSPLIGELEALCRWAEHQAPKLESGGKKGRPADRWLDRFIELVARAFEAAGGTPSAARESMEGEDGKRRRKTPFLRVLLYVHERIPAHRRASSETALADRAYDVLAVAKRWKEQSSDKVNRGKKRG